MAALFERVKWSLMMILGVGILGGMVFLGVTRQTPAPVQIIPPAPTVTPAPVRIHVMGAVAQPEVYTLPHGSILQEAITAAGGPTADADMGALNLARVLVDGEQIMVPRVGEVAADPLPTSPVAEGPININTATQAELETLPGIGPALAQRIIDYRTTNGPFGRIEEIENVSGIGPATFADIKDLITVD